MLSRAPRTYGIAMDRFDARLSWVRASLKWLAVVAACLPSMGCLSIYHRERHTFHVFDAATGEPLPDVVAGVGHDRLSYPFSLNYPPGMTVYTGPDGLAVLRGARNWNPGFSFHLTGYRPEVLHPEANPGTMIPCPVHRKRCYEVYMHRSDSVRITTSPPPRSP